MLAEAVFDAVRTVALGLNDRFWREQTFTEIKRVSGVRTKGTFHTVGRVLSLVFYSRMLTAGGRSRPCLLGQSAAASCRLRPESWPGAWE